MKQLPLFPDTTPLPPASRRDGPESSHAAEAAMNKSRRRHRQVDAVLARLRQGPATNRELAALSLKYTGRVSDLRALGYAIRCDRCAVGSGATIYTLIRESTTA